MSYRTLAFSALSSLLLLAGSCKSALEPTGLGSIAGDTVTNPTGDDRAFGGQGSDEPAGDDHGGGQGGQGRGGADDPANHD